MNRTEQLQEIRDLLYNWWADSMDDKERGAAGLIIGAINRLLEGKYENQV